MCVSTWRKHVNINGADGHGLRLECHLDVTRSMKCLQIIWLMEDDLP